MKMKKGIMASD
jgi:hypothetical protein